MATIRIPILGAFTLPDPSGNIFMEPLDVIGTNDIWKHGGYRFRNSGSSRIGLRGIFNVPKDYVGTAAIVAYWTSTATSGNVVWDFDYRAVAGDDAASLDQSGVQESVTVTDAAPGASMRRNVASVNLTSANLAADSSVQFEFFRDKSDAADTMAADAVLVGLFFQYAN